jgi:transposase
MVQKIEKKGRGRRKKKGVLTKDKRMARGGRIDSFKVGIIVGAVLRADARGEKLNLAELGRSQMVRAHRTTVEIIAKRFREGLLNDGPPTQAHKPSTVVKKVLKRRKLVERAALMRVLADDGTPRASNPTLESIRLTLPEDMRPLACSTVMRDLNTQGVWRLSTVATPLLGPEWKAKRLQYAKDAIKAYPEELCHDMLIVTDEALFSLNNSSVACKKEYRKRGSAPMQVKKCGYPATVMVWAAIGKQHRFIVVHEEENDEESDIVPGEWKDRQEMVKKLRMDVSKTLDVNKRYTKAQLLKLSERAQSDWLRVEWRWNLGRGKGVNRFDHCDRCLRPLAAAVKNTHHFILEDNARIHTSNYSTVFKAHHKLQLVEGHPPSSSDLNPCEFVWAWVKERVSFKGPPTLPALVTAVKKEFNSIPQHTVDAWVDTYWARLRACIANNGDWVGARECRVPRTLR